jgi:serine/threonine-protein kinase
MTIHDEFDAYHQWLSIPPSEQPPTLYRLLGLSPFEGDVNVIHAAADRQMAYLRSMTAGKRADHSQRLLNEISAARVTLTGAMKPNYDAILRSAAPANAADEQADDPSPPASVMPSSSAKPAPAKPAAKAPVATPQRRFGPFDLLELAKESPYGDAYKACHRDSGRIVSLKILPPAGAKNREIISRFQREAQLVTQLRHPNLIAGLGAGVEGAQPWLALEYVVGTDLSTLVRQVGPLPVSQAVDYTVQAAHGLMQLHLRNVFHRNVKPAVLLADVQGNLKVTNLFLAKIGEHADMAMAGGELTMTGQSMGTAEYLPPEQAADAKSVDQRGDIYALGCTLHFLLTGRPPYVEKSLMKKLLAHSTGPIPSLRAARGDVPEQVDAIFQKMLAKKPEGRFQSMAEIIQLFTPATPAPAPVAARGRKKGFWARLFGG